VSEIAAAGATADPAASDLLASVSTFGPFSGLEELIEDHAAEILLSVGLVTGGIAYAAGRGGARGLSHPGSSIPRKWLRARDPLAQDARRARPNEADPGALPQRVLLITASARWGSRPLLRRWLEEGGVTVHEASESDWETGLIARPDLILLEHDPRTLDGLSLLRRIADAPPGRRSTPVLIFTASEDWAEETARGLELGAIDALIGPITPAELLARVRRAIRLRRRLEELERGATSDSLTGLANRAAFEGRLAREWDECLRLGRPVALAVADLDHFKRINDTCGHPSGDEVLRRVAWALAAEVGASGSVARYGGEEFVILLPGCDRPGSLAIAERIRRRVGGLGVDDLRLPSPRITISVGVAWTDAPSQIAPQEMLNRADQALYEAKAGGRDLARIWGGMPEETTCVAPW
jgi:diguanylate cyclase (GGDEF)-like protein